MKKDLTVIYEEKDILHGIKRREKKKKIMHEIQKILSAENQRRKKQYTDKPGGEGEAGIFYIARSDLMQKNADYIRGKQNYVRKYQCNIIVCDWLIILILCLQELWAGKKRWRL